MIFVDRTTVSAPDVLFRAYVSSWAESARRFFATPLSQRRQERFDAEPELANITGQLRSPLEELFAGKCAYCESSLESFNIDRFRPAANATGLRKEVSPDHYWWLALTWENLYAACSDCVKAKGTRFPVHGRRALAPTVGDALDEEQPLLIDPCRDQPSLHFRFEFDGRVRAQSERADVTIATLGLNRPRLIKARSGVMRQTRYWLRELSPEQIRESSRLENLEEVVAYLFASGSADEVAGQLLWSLGPTGQYAGAARQEAERWRSSRLSAQLFGSARLEAQPKLVRSRKHSGFRTNFLSKVRIKGVRAISDLTLDLSRPESAEAPWVVLLGENGTGKSSILQSIAVALGGPNRVYTSPNRMIRQGRVSASISLTMSGGEQMRVDLRKGRRGFEFTGLGVRSAVLAYGATRLLPPSGHGGSRTRVFKVRNLFDPTAPLIGVQRWLTSLPTELFDYVVRALKDVLGLARTARMRRLRRIGVVRVDLFGSEVELSELSDGYQTVLALTCDIIAGLLKANKGVIEAAEGIVLIDELDAHLHPQWRMRIVQSLRRAFPRVQFIVTTHDPLCLRGLRDGEVVVLRRTQRGRVFAVPDLPPVEGLRIDQLLTSEYFGLSSTLDPEIEAKYQELYRLLAVRSPRGSQTARIATLRMELEPFDLPGTSVRERRLLQIIDKEIAQLRVTADADRRDEITRQADALVAEDLKAALNMRPVLT
jgi:uncharacterized protein (TIGR02646 family)